MSDEEIEFSAVWCPHNESYKLCWECAKRSLQPTGGDGNGQ